MKTAAAGRIQQVRVRTECECVFWEPHSCPACGGKGYVKAWVDTAELARELARLIPGEVKE